MNDAAPLTTHARDAADIASVRPAEAAIVARLHPRIVAAYAARLGSRHTVSAGAAAEEARAVTSRSAINAEADPAVRAELEAARAELARVDAVYWRIVSRWEKVAHAIAAEGQKRTAHIQIAPLDYDDLLQSARIGLWRGVLRWQPNGGRSPSGYASDWARATAQRAATEGDLCGAARNTGWKIPAGNIAERADAPAPIEHGSEKEASVKASILAMTPAPEADDGDRRRAGAAAQICQIRGVVTRRQGEVIDAYLAIESGGIDATLEKIGAAVGISKERARQLIIGIGDAKLRGRGL
jgi:hypothetical protein